MALTTRNLTIMFTDIVGYTERAASQSRAEHVALLHQHDRLLHPLIRQFGGTLIKSMGDGLLVTFRSSTMGLRCAMAMQDALARFNDGREAPDQLHIRAALASGDVQLQNNDVFGEAVSIASRIEAITPADQIYFAASVYLAMNKAEVSAESIASRTLKGIPSPVDIYRVLPRGEHGRFHDDELADEHDREAPVGWRDWLGRRRAAIAGGVVALAAAAGWWYFVPPPAQSPAPPPAGETLPQQVQSSVQDVESLLAAGEVEQAQQALGQALAANESSAELLLAQGHLAFANKRRETGIDAYRRALALAPPLADNPRLAENLVSALGWESQSARKVLEQYASPAMVDALAQRTAQPGYWGRWHAVATLDAIGQSERVRRFDAALLDLQEGDNCDKRREAVKRLGQLNDRRALLVLKPIAEMPLLTRLTSPDACLVDSAQAAVERLD